MGRVAALPARGALTGAQTNSVHDPDAQAPRELALTRLRRARRRPHHAARAGVARGAGQPVHRPADRGLRGHAGARPPVAPPLSRDVAARRAACAALFTLSRPARRAGAAGATRVFTCPCEAVQLGRLSRQERSNRGKHRFSRRRMMARPARVAVLGKRATWFSQWQKGRNYAVPGRQDEGSAPLRRWARWRLWLLR